MTFRKITMLLQAFMLCACSSYHDVYTATGSTIYAVTCRLESLAPCMEKAGEICGTMGYRVVSGDGIPVPAVKEGDKTPPPDTGIKLQRKMYLECHSPNSDSLRGESP